MKDYKVTLTLVTGISAESKKIARRSVIETVIADLGLNIEIGPAGERLPFEIDGIKAERLGYDA